LYRQKSLEQAKWYYEQAVLVHPEQLSDFRVAAYVGLASTCREQGDIEQAEQYIQQARCVLDELSPDGASGELGSIYEELGDIALQKDEYQRASDHFEAALGQSQLPEKQEELYHKLGVALGQDGQYERALEYLRQALAIELSLPQTNKEYIGELLLHMGQCEYGLGHFQQAIVLLEKAQETVDPSVLAVLHLWLGRSYYWLKRFDNAAECYKKALRGTRFLSPDWREALKYFVGTRIAR
jgi:tetratricopeptide (TPR) repeat protein